MGETQDPQGCPFKGLQGLAENSAEGGPACDNIVIGAEDDRSMDNAQRQLMDQAIKVSRGIDTDMGSEPVSQEPRKIINQWNVSEMIFAS